MIKLATDGGIFVGALSSLVKLILSLRIENTYLFPVLQLMSQPVRWPGAELLTTSTTHRSLNLKLRLILIPSLYCVRRDLGRAFF